MSASRGLALAPLPAARLNRGRPARKENRQVLEDILRAAEECFGRKNPEEVSTKDIALRAGTRSAMIYYYFGSKEGLLAELIRRSVEAIHQDFCVMQRALDRNELRNPTREMIAFLVAVFRKHPTLCRIIAAEQAREESPLTRLYLRQWGARARTMMVGAMAQLAAQGYYREDADIERVFAMIRSVVFFPMSYRMHLAQAGECVERYFDDEWLDFVSAVFDSYLRPANRK